MDLSLQRSIKSTEELINERLPTAISYDEYMAMVSPLVLIGKSTGPEDTDVKADYTKLNYRRMKRWNKTIRISDEGLTQLSKLDRKITWLVLTESWCGDAAPSLPIMHKLAGLNTNLSLKILLRDENLDLMERFLTNGAMSIPKLIAITDDTKTVLGEWGPRPHQATEMVNVQKDTPEGLTPEFREKLQLWYNKDKGQSIVSELLSCLFLK